MMLEVERKQGSAPETARCNSRFLHVLREAVVRRSEGALLPDAEIIKAHPELMPELADKLRDLDRVHTAEEMSRAKSESISASSPGSPLAAVLPIAADSFPHYELLGEIHRGGQGVVYRALQESTHREVAIKVMREGPFLGPHDKARFEREVRILASLRHPNIVTIHDSGLAAGHHYFVMDYISGATLDVHAQATAQPIQSLLELFAQICEAVNTAHLRGIIHRDLKPGNILVDDNGEPYVLDFGLAKAGVAQISDDASSPSMTMTGQFLGSLPWASPEQAEGTPERIDLRTDIYSLGVTMYQILTGQFPYAVTGSMREVLSHIVDDEPPRPSTLRNAIDSELDIIVLKCLAKDPARRYQTAGELARDLRRHLAGEAIEARRDSTLYILRKRLRRYRVTMITALAFVGLLIGSTVVAWRLYAESQESLWKSHLAQARAQIVTGLPGQQHDSLHALSLAAEIRPNLELRNQAIAALTRTDVKQLSRLKLPQGAQFPRYDAQLQRVAMKLPGNAACVLAIGSGEELLRLSPTRGRSEPVLSPNGRYLAENVRQGPPRGCRVWDVDEDRVVLEISEYANESSLEFSADSAHLVLGTADGSLHKYELTTGKKETLFKMDNPIRSLRLDPLGEKLAFVSGEGDRVFVHNTLDATQRVFSDPGLIRSLAWHPSGRYIACAGSRIVVWDVHDGSQVSVIDGHKGRVPQLAFTCDGELLLSSSWDGTMKFWDWLAATELLVIPGVNVGRTAPNGRIAMDIRGGGDAEVRIAELTVPVLRRLGKSSKSASTDIARQPQDRLMAIAHRNGVQLWDLDAGELLQDLQIGRTETALFTRPTGQLITSARSGVYRWPVATESEQVSVGPPELLLKPAGGTPRAWLSEDGETLAACYDDRKFAVLDLSSPDDVRFIGNHPKLAFVTLSPDKQLAATGTWGGKQVKVWRLGSGEELRSFPLDGSRRVAFTPDGKWLVVAGEQENIVLDTATWEQVRSIKRPNYTPSFVAFARGGDLVAMLTATTRIQLLDPRSWDLVAELEARERFGPLMFTASDRSLVCVSSAQLIYTWDLAELRQRLERVNLDWDAPPFPPMPPDRPNSLSLRVNLGDAGHAPQ